MLPAWSWYPRQHRDGWWSLLPDKRQWMWWRVLREERDLGIVMALMDGESQVLRVQERRSRTAAAVASPVGGLSVSS